MNLNHREIERLEGLVKALKMKINVFEKKYIKYIPTTIEEDLMDIEQEIEFWNNPKNF